MRLFTIGFTKKSAEHFFETLCRSGAKRVVDVRLNNVSQLAGFAKKSDLAYFLRRSAGLNTFTCRFSPRPRICLMHTGKSGPAGRLTSSGSSRLCRSGKSRRRFHAS